MILKLKVSIIERLWHHFRKTKDWATTYINMNKIKFFWLDLPLALVCSRIDRCYFRAAASSLSIANTKVLRRKTILLPPCCIYLTSPGMLRRDGGSGVILHVWVIWKYRYSWTATFMERRYQSVKSSWALKVNSQTASL